MRANSDVAAGHAPSLTLAPITHASGSIHLPGSKSSSIRAMLMAAHALGSTRLINLLASDDTKVMRECLAALGFVLQDDGAALVIGGAASAPNKHAALHLGNSGLSIRTLLPALVAAGGTFTMHGVARMHQRPIGDLVTSLHAIGANISWLGTAGFPPLKVAPARIDASTPLRVAGHASSQFLTGLLQAAPIWHAHTPVAIEVEGELISRPYVALTIDLMRRFGVQVEGNPAQQAPSFCVPRGARYSSPGELLIEGDASSACYFLALGALTGGAVRIEGIGRDSVQPDVGLLPLLEQMGASVTSGAGYIAATSAGVASGFRFRPVDVDLNHMPDGAMTVAVLAMFASGPSRIRNIGSWRVKETDRIAAMACELRKFGARIEEGHDWLGITPPVKWLPARVDTYDDHRMAMSLSLAACSGVAVDITDPGSVAKTFPDYFERLAALTS
jgi:3-phosphoshikimate 1-carboxyvinyltransferase